MADEVIGKLFTKEEADKLFGAVLSRMEIDTSVLSGLCEKSPNVLLFNLREDSEVILGSGRIPLHPDANMAIAEEEVFHVFSISIVKELISKGGDAKTFIEKRNGHLTITKGSNTLQNSADCPPYCS